MNQKNYKPVSNKKITKIIRAIFGLTKKKAECFFKLRKIENQGICITNLIEEFDSERSIVQKNMKYLLKKGLITRNSVTLSEFEYYCKKNKNLAMIPKSHRGYLYLYKTISDRELIKKIRETTNFWIETTNSWIETELKN